MLNSLQRAVQHFYSRVGRSIMESAPLPAYAEPVQSATCSVCGVEHVHGYFDSRPNAQVFRCDACWSFFHPSPVAFPEGGRDRSFAGVVKNAWVVDSDGVLWCPIGGKNSKDAAYRLAASKVGIQFVQEDKPMQWLYERLFDGRFGPVLLWASFGMNKLKSIQSMALSTSDTLVSSDGGQQIYYNMSVLRPIASAIRALDDDAFWSDTMQHWLRRGMETEPEARAEQRQALLSLGMPQTITSLSFTDRELVSRVTQRGKPERKKSKEK